MVKESLRGCYVLVTRIHEYLNRHLLQYVSISCSHFLPLM
ncbi:hypothetical protein HMPREF1991_00664 [Hoylesella loescheii DSM 19665 = JCM 12249 = ATCC 15930]|uniref:Uncharacterized protein n=1 Tax=Hoylesella loescheii DSM 19665 = JCM 12249 = ATCC 15930 TaxID=1122985 RepID=A0A069QKH0_HOYLO|nr:hypothetical protein HMPREF1991_00664 [Hoylesella loescheii DSM 19665 = JCM 12249 = ATCC 15930]